MPTANFRHFLNIASCREYLIETRVTRFRFESWGHRFQNVLKFPRKILFFHEIFTFSGEKSLKTHHIHLSLHLDEYHKFLNQTLVASDLIKYSLHAVHHLKSDQNLVGNEFNSALSTLRRLQNVPRQLENFEIIEKWRKLVDLVIYHGFCKNVFKTIFRKL